MSIKAEIISIGNEIISGDVIDTNSSYIAKNLLNLGIETLWHTSIGDLPDDIKNSIRKALERSDIIFTTGGLGPTDDDFSVKVVAEALDKKLVFVEDIWENIQESLIRAGRKIDNYNKKEAYIPEGAKYFLNHAGSAPCVFIEQDEKKIFMLPGVPSEMKYFMQTNILPAIKDDSTEVIKTKKIKLSGIPEASVNEKIKDMVEKDAYTIAFLPKSSELEVKITVKAKDETTALKILEDAKNEIVSRFDKFIYGYDDDSIEEILHDILIAESKTISMAESCTGGLISKMLTDVSGSSSYINLNLVTYSNEAKMKMLEVKKETLENFGAVSEQTAEEMALGIKKLSGSDFGLAITGIAGPTGGTEEKPVGLVYIGITDGVKVNVHKIVSPPKLPREEIRVRAAKKALHLLKEFICQN